MVINGPKFPGWGANEGISYLTQHVRSGTIMHTWNEMCSTFWVNWPIILNYLKTEMNLFLDQPGTHTCSYCMNSPFPVTHADHPLSFHYPNELRPAAPAVLCLCLWRLYWSCLATASHTKHDKWEPPPPSLPETVITVLPDKITVTLHARLLTALAAQMNYLCYLRRGCWNGTKLQTRLIAALLT